MMYFRLNPECYYVKGKACGAIYDLATGNLYSLNAGESEILDRCETNTPVEQADSFLAELTASGLGAFYDSRPYIEKIRVGSPIENYQPGRAPQVKRAVLEINNACDSQCGFCGNKNLIRGMGCLGCNTWDEEGSPVSAERWKQLIDELYDLDCTSITFTGGDLSRVHETLHELIAYASEKIPNLFLSLNEKNVDLEKMQELYAKAKPIVQIIKIQNIHPDYYYLYQVMDGTAETVNPGGHTNIFYEQVFDKGDPANRKREVMPRKKFPKISLNQFFHNREFHPCLGKSLAFTWRGDILPCIMMRDTPLGTIQGQPLYSVFSGKGRNVMKYWLLNLNQISPCNDCEFRFACSDCRATDVQLAGDITKQGMCGYDPAEGKWA